MHLQRNPRLSSLALANFSGEADAKGLTQNTIAKYISLWTSTLVSYLHLYTFAVFLFITPWFFLCADVNFLGLIIGPRGTTQKQLQEESGARIIVRGRGANKNETPREDDDDMHVYLSADSEQKVYACVFSHAPSHFHCMPSKP